MENRVLEMDDEQPGSSSSSFEVYSTPCGVMTSLSPQSDDKENYRTHKRIKPVKIIRENAYIFSETGGTAESSPASTVSTPNRVRKRKRKVEPMQVTRVNFVIQQNFESDDRTTFECPQDPNKEIGEDNLENREDHLADISNLDSPTIIVNNDTIIEIADKEKIPGNSEDQENEFQIDKITNAETLKEMEVQQKINDESKLKIEEKNAEEEISTEMKKNDIEISIKISDKQDDFKIKNKGKFGEHKILKTNPKHKSAENLKEICEIKCDRKKFYNPEDIRKFIQKKKQERILKEKQMKLEKNKEQEERRKKLEIYKSYAAKIQPPSKNKKNSSTSAAGDKIGNSNNFHQFGKGNDNFKSIDVENLDPTIIQSGKKLLEMISNFKIPTFNDSYLSTKNDVKEDCSTSNCSDQTAGLCHSSEDLKAEYLVRNIEKDLITPPKNSVFENEISSIVRHKIRPIAKIGDSNSRSFVAPPQGQSPNLLNGSTVNSNKRGHSSFDNDVFTSEIKRGAFSPIAKFRKSEIPEFLNFTDLGKNSNENKSEISLNLEKSNLNISQNADNSKNFKAALQTSFSDFHTPKQSPDKIKVDFSMPKQTPFFDARTDFPTSKQSPFGDETIICEKISYFADNSKIFTPEKNQFWVDGSFSENISNDKHLDENGFFSTPECKKFADANKINFGNLDSLIENIESITESSFMKKFFTRFSDNSYSVNSPGKGCRSNFRKFSTSTTSNEILKRQRDLNSSGSSSSMFSGISKIDSSETSSRSITSVETSITVAGATTSKTRLSGIVPAEDSFTDYPNSDLDISVDGFLLNTYDELIIEEDSKLNKQLEKLRKFESDYLTYVKKKISSLETSKERYRSMNNDQAIKMLKKKQRAILLKAFQTMQKLEMLKEAIKNIIEDRKSKWLSQKEKLQTGTTSSSKIKKFSPSMRKTNLELKEDSFLGDRTIMAGNYKDYKLNDVKKSVTNLKEIGTSPINFNSDCGTQQSALTKMKHDDENSEKCENSINQKEIKPKSSYNQEDLERKSEEGANHEFDGLQKSAVRLIERKSISNAPPIKQSLSPAVTLLKKQCLRLSSGSENNSPLLSFNDTTLSEQSDVEVRVSALQDELNRCKTEASKLRRMMKQKRKEFLRAQEQSLIKQIEAYERYIQKISKELLDVNTIVPITKPQIKKPCYNRRLSNSSKSNTDIDMETSNKDFLNDLIPQKQDTNLVFDETFLAKIQNMLMEGNKITFKVESTFEVPVSDIADSSLDHSSSNTVVPSRFSELDYENNSFDNSKIEPASDGLGSVKIDLLPRETKELFENDTSESIEELLTDRNSKSGTSTGTEILKTGNVSLTSNGEVENCVNKELNLTLNLNLELVPSVQENNRISEEANKNPENSISSNKSYFDDQPKNPDLFSSFFPQLYWNNIDCKDIDLEDLTADVSNTEIEKTDLKSITSEIENFTSRIDNFVGVPTAEDILSKIDQFSDCSDYSNKSNSSSTKSESYMKTMESVSMKSESDSQILTILNDLTDKVMSVGEIFLNEDKNENTNFLKNNNFNFQNEIYNSARGESSNFESLSEEIKIYSTSSIHTVPENFEEKLSDNENFITDSKNLTDCSKNEYISDFENISENSNFKNFNGSNDTENVSDISENLNEISESSEINKSFTDFENNVTSSEDHSIFDFDFQTTSKNHYNNNFSFFENSTPGKFISDLSLPSNDDTFLSEIAEQNFATDFENNLKKNNVQLKMDFNLDFENNKTESDQDFENDTLGMINKIKNSQNNSKTYFNFDFEKSDKKDFSFSNSISEELSDFSFDIGNNSKTDIENRIPAEISFTENFAQNQKKIEFENKLEDTNYLNENSEFYSEILKTSENLSDLEICNKTFVVNEEKKKISSNDVEQISEEILSDILENVISSSVVENKTKFSSKDETKSILKLHDFDQIISDSEAPFLRALVAKSVHTTENITSSIFENLIQESIDVVMDIYVSRFGNRSKNSRRKFGNEIFSSNVTTNSENKENQPDFFKDIQSSSSHHKQELSVIYHNYNDQLKVELEREFSTSSNNSWSDEDFELGQINCQEAEELRKQQMQIEQEIQELQARQKYIPPYVYFREIPNKPPPPYTPPDNQISLKIPETKEEICNYVEKYTEIILENLERGIKFEDIEPPEKFFNSKKIDKNISIHKRFMFDLNKELIQDMYEKKSKFDQKIPWLALKKCKKPDGLKNFHKSEITDYVKRDMLALFGIEPKIKRENWIIQWSKQKKTDYVDKLLITELQEEESEWTNYEQDEIIIKNRITDEILNDLLLNTYKVVDMALKKKLANI